MLPTNDFSAGQCEALKLVLIGRMARIEGVTPLKSVPANEISHSSGGLQLYALWPFHSK